MTIELQGEGNDYVGKGLSGGRLIIYPPRHSGIGDSRRNIIVGNTVLYGAIAGECFFSGVAGERFCVRNSGAVAVIEGVGDHGCEYMTGGVVVCLGPTGRNFAAGMSGGIAYILDSEHEFSAHCNQGTVTLEKISADAGPAAAADNMPDDMPENMADNLLDDLSIADETRLKRLLERHVHHTNSRIAKTVLRQWPDYLGKFVKVMPVDYRRALQRLRPQNKVTLAPAAVARHGSHHG